MYSISASVYLQDLFIALLHSFIPPILAYMTMFIAYTIYSHLVSCVRLCFSTLISFTILSCIPFRLTFSFSSTADHNCVCWCQGAPGAAVGTPGLLCSGRSIWHSPEPPLPSPQRHTAGTPSSHWAEGPNLLHASVSTG